jgi:nitrite reductase (NADH) small subunit
LYAFKNACPHQGHRLSGGRIVDGRLSCPGHNWQFELSTGRCVKGDTEITLKRFKVVVEEESVFVETDDY